MKTKSITLISLFVAVMIAFGAIPSLVIPFIPVPFTFQMLGVMLVGSILGARKGFAAMLVFLGLVAAGLPVLSGFHGGMGVLLGPTGGYVLAWPIAALIIGLFTDHIQLAGKLKLIWYYLAIFAGIAIIYLIGVPWFAFFTNTPMFTAIGGNIPLFLLDLVKAAIAAVVASQLRQRLTILHRTRAM